jgi:hypothetical protein
MNYVGIDWAYGRAAWCARSESGAIDGEGLIPADEDGLVHLALRLGPEVKACVEMMSGAIWVKDQLELAGWEVQVAHARKVSWCQPSGWPQFPIERSASGFAAALTWSSCGPRLATGSSAC